MYLHVCCLVLWLWWPALVLVERTEVESERACGFVGPGPATVPPRNRKAALHRAAFSFMRVGAGGIGRAGVPVLRATCEQLHGGRPRCRQSLSKAGQYAVYATGVVFGFPGRFHRRVAVR